MQFPLYHMKMRKDRTSPWEQCLRPLHNAAVLYDSGYVDVEFGELVVLNERYDCRSITDDDKRQISKAADEYSASK